MTSNTGASLSPGVSVGPSLSTILFVVFLVLKLTHVINWSWWWVTAPLWLPFVVFLALALLIVIAWFITFAIVSVFSSWR